MLEKNGARFSLPLRWTVALAGIVVVTMILGLVAIHKIQREAMTALTFEYGHSLAQFIATENAELVLLEDWVGIQVIVEQIEGKEIINGLSIADYNNIVRGSTDANLAGQRYQQPSAAELLAVRDNTRIYAMNLPTGESVLRFDLPIMFKDIDVGTVYLDLTQAPWQRATNLTIITVLIQTLLILIVIIVMGYALHTHLILPLRILERALAELANGHHEYRIGEQHKNKWGSLFALYNRTAEHLHKVEDEKFALLAGALPSQADTQIAGDKQPADTPAEKPTKEIGPDAAQETSKPPVTEDGKSATVTPPTASFEQLSSAPKQTERESNAEKATTQVIPARAAHPYITPAPEPTSDDDSNEATRVVEVSKLSLSSQRKRNQEDTKREK